jgi:hypothetical protein
LEQAVTMISGHKTKSIFECYIIVIFSNQLGWHWRPGLNRKTTDFLKYKGSGLHNLHIDHFLYPVDRFSQLPVRPSLEFDSPGGLRDSGLTYAKS